MPAGRACARAAIDDDLRSFGMVLSNFLTQHDIDGRTNRRVWSGIAHRIGTVENDVSLET